MTDTGTGMIELADPADYEKSLAFLPYKSSLFFVAETVVRLAPPVGKVLDVMCGPGYLLGQIRKGRPDLILRGVDIDGRYVAYGNEHYPVVNFVRGDILDRPHAHVGECDIVLCTGALHHIPYEWQESVLANIASVLKRGTGIAIVADCYVEDYETEEERKVAANKLGSAYLSDTILNHAPDDVVKQALNIQHNDVMGYEYKTSLVKREPLLKKHFARVEKMKTWGPLTRDYGDYVHICRL